MHQRMVLGMAALALAALAAGCGDDEGQGAVPSTTSSSAATASQPGDWCDELDALREAEEAPPSGVVDQAPDDIREPLRALVAAADIDAEDLTPEVQADLMGALAAVEAWGHEHCGGDHPLCSLWLTMEGEIAASAFVDDEGTDATETSLVALVGELDDELREHAPPEVEADVAAFLETFPAHDDAAEREAEAAVDALDQWAYDEGCEGAEPPEGAE